MAVTEEGEGARVGSSFAGRAGSGSSETTVATSACNSFCAGAGSEAGSDGAEGASRFTQQAGVAQCLLSQPVEQQLAFTDDALPTGKAEAAKTPCQARTNPSRSTAAILMQRDLIVSDWSFGNGNPCLDCQV